MQRFFVVDREFGSLRSLCRTRTFFPFLALCLRLAGFQPARLDIRTRLLPLELGILITHLLKGLFEFGHSVRELPNDRQQRLHEWSAFFGPDLRKLELHTSQATESNGVQLRQFSEFLRSYNESLQGMIAGRVTSFAARLRKRSLRMAVLNMFSPGGLTGGSQTQFIQNPWGTPAAPATDVWIQCTMTAVQINDTPSLAGLGIIEIEFLDAQGQMQQTTFGDVNNLNNVIPENLPARLFVSQLVSVTVALILYDTGALGSVTLFQWG
jgi:hypothetical protein